MLQNIFSKKEKGEVSVGGMIAAMLTFIVVIAVTLSYASWHTQFSKKDDVDLVIRSYLLAMENTGYLTEDMQDDLKTELAGIGVKDIDLSGTTISKTDYGKVVTLSVKGRLVMENVPSLNITDKGMFQFTEGSEINIHVSRDGIALCE